jgi:hypothetical protein
MWHPVLRGHIDRRLLLNYRVDPELVQRCLPAPFRPKIANGWGMAGICLIRMRRLGPRFLPFPLFGASENGALRFAVEWEQDGQLRQGVYIPARYTTSCVAAFAGMRFFPGKHYMARFQVEESDDHFRIRLDSSHLQLAVSARPVTEFAGSKVFSSLEEASAFFHAGAYGYSEARAKETFDGVELRFPEWKMSPLAVYQISCNFFDDRQRFPAGTAEFDHALLMHGLDMLFLNQKSFCCLLPPERQPQPPTSVSGAAR